VTLISLESGLALILLDTMVWSEFRKSRPHPKVSAWFRVQTASDLYLSVISIGEIERGISRASDRVFAAELSAWLEDTLRFYADRILPVTPDIARRWGRLSAELNHDDVDLLIAATAASHRLTVATRNVRHFKPTGVNVVDPYL
jgi:toxin FitB